jgi:aryl-alcohol dehydrogenase-like predicted oxidoreductase
MSHITFGLWPIAGITTVGVTEQDAKDTIIAAIANGLTAFDTAFSYGYDGECDRLLGSSIGGQRDRFTIIGKVGQRWTPQQTRIVDASPKTLTADTETSLRRIGIERFDLLMLHSPDPNVPIERSADAIVDLRRRGLCARIGVCNVDLDQYQRFASAAPCEAIQCPLNLIQRSSLEQLIPQCQRDGCEVYVFWTLMKGLLAGRITRDHTFPQGDVRPSYEIFQGEARRKTHDVLDGMRQISRSVGCTVAQLSIGWALSQPGVTSTLVGARRPDQVREIAAARPLAQATLGAIDALVG